MAWLQSAYRRGLAWVWDQLWPARLVVPYDAIASEEPQIIRTSPGARIAACLRIRRETPMGIGRLAVILSECIRESPISTSGGLAGQPARGG
jgi:hypothetical protein